MVQVDRDEFEINWRTLLHFEQNIKHAVAVFAARHADHDAVAFFNHVELADGLTHLTAQAFFELVCFAFNLDGLGFLPGLFGLRIGIVGHHVGEHDRHVVLATGGVGGGDQGLRVALLRQVGQSDCEMQRR